MLFGSKVRRQIDINYEANIPTDAFHPQKYFTFVGLTTTLVFCEARSDLKIHGLLYFKMKV